MVIYEPSSDASTVSVCTPLLSYIPEDQEMLSELSFHCLPTRLHLRGTHIACACTRGDVRTAAALHGFLHFFLFETRNINECVTFIERNGLHKGMSRVFATGGGAFKFARLFYDRLRIQFDAVDEMQARAAKGMTMEGGWGEGGREAVRD